MFLRSCAEHSMESEHSLYLDELAKRVATSDECGLGGGGGVRLISVSTVCRAVKHRLGMKVRLTVPIAPKRGTRELQERRREWIKSVQHGMLRLGHQANAAADGDGDDDDAVDTVTVSSLEFVDECHVNDRAMGNRRRGRGISGTRLVAHRAVGLASGGRALNVFAGIRVAVRAGACQCCCVCVFYFHSSLCFFLFPF